MRKQTDSDNQRKRLITYSIITKINTANKRDTPFQGETPSHWGRKVNLPAVHPVLSFKIL